LGKRKGFLPREAVGKRVAIRFDDHSLRETTETICELQGTVIRVTDSEVIVRYWTVFEPGTEIAELSEENHEFCRIVQGTFVQWAVAEPKRWRQL
jgi:hypothetical protein